MSTQGSGPSVQSELASLLECPVCLEPALPPIIYQCNNGHLICSDCHPKLNSCPTCRGNLGEIRNLAMERVASMAQFPCKYSSDGCASLLLHTDKPNHEDACEHRPYNCPRPGNKCTWQGKLDQVMSHLLEIHRLRPYGRNWSPQTVAEGIDVPGPKDWFRLHSRFDCNFMFVLMKRQKNGEDQFCALVQLIGPRTKAEKFTYKLELNGKKRKLTWEGTPYSIRDEPAVQSTDFLRFDSDTAKLFSNNGKLAITMTLSLASN